MILKINCRITSAQSKTIQYIYIFFIYICLTNKFKRMYERSDSYKFTVTQSLIFSC